MTSLEGINWANTTVVDAYMEVCKVPTSLLNHNFLLFQLIQKRSDQTELLPSTYIFPFLFFPQLLKFGFKRVARYTKNVR